MHTVVANAVQFGPKVIKCLSGQVPKQISGSYFRNGPGMLNYGNQIIQHWFNGDGCILKLHFDKGQCTAQMKLVQTPLYKRRLATKTTKDGILKKLWVRWREGAESSNPANTSILCLKNSPNFLALCEGGKPYVMNKQNLQCQGFEDYGWIKSAYSAHPKVDPDNGDIFNIGMSLPTITIMKSTKDMKKICQNSFKLRQLQSIHDVCLAGDYLIIFEASIRFNLKQLLWGNKFFFQCKSFDSTLPVLVHIYSKQSLKHIKTISTEPFYSFHFTNGYSDKQKIVIEYIKYDIQSSKALFRLIADVPKYTQPDFHAEYIGSSTLQQMTINLSDFSTKVTKSVKINGQFPVCEDHQVGKQWRFTYAVGSLQEQMFKFNTLYRYDRKQQILQKLQLQQDAYINEPCIIRTQNNLYLLCVINRKKNSYVQIFQADSLKKVCQLQLSQFVPAGFHGKWDKI